MAREHTAHVTIKASRSFALVCLLARWPWIVAGVVLALAFEQITRHL